MASTNDKLRGSKEIARYAGVIELIKSSGLKKPTPSISSSSTTAPGSPSFTTTLSGTEKQVHPLATTTTHEVDFDQMKITNADAYVDRWFLCI